LLLLAGLVILWDAIAAVIQATAARSIAEAIFDIAENGLLALILAELVHTLLVSLGGGHLTPEPFLVIAIIAILRKMLLVTVLVPPPPDTHGRLSPSTAELLALGLLTLVLGAVLAVLRAYHARRTTTAPTD
jgi:uncharacterized membrane protein (DUF373 family)